MDPTTPTPEQITNVTEAIKAALWLGVALAIYAYLSHRTEDDGATRWQRWRDWLVAHYLTSSSDGAPAAGDVRADQSIDQSTQTSLEQQTTPAPVAGLCTAAPDMDAETWPMPPVSAYLSDTEFLVMLARQKTRGGGWRLSANAIVKIVGGDRTQVLATIREIRDGPPEFKPLSSEQQAARAALGLER